MLYWNTYVFNFRTNGFTITSIAFLLIGSVLQIHIKKLQNGKNRQEFEISGRKKKRALISIKEIKTFLLNNIFINYVEELKFAKLMQLRLILKLPKIF